eukprot:CAMPEP_0174309526 /NCGR_PEP_ID=MMETSP0810-20121108/2467_1 /TAXON_ID=73025 ORGANISM="Eutreptiella gymnastica-like, Strain CCMP1594" /NCGR_SAMPLE_ID=MMETSP0810 /ASSEMBLY_ACC=CAM_ASM_000659 /LENGTH=100 /DNA_ID=CAMNT_0015417185 /DNA_START=305 /DNA_END=608 /DNA_ORIENTATION=+
MSFCFLRLSTAQNQSSPLHMIAARLSGSEAKALAFSHVHRRLGGVFEGPLPTVVFGDLDNLWHTAAQHNRNRDTNVDLCTVYPCSVQPKHFHGLPMGHPY